MIFDNWSAINQISSFNKWEIQEIPAPLLEFKSFYLDNHLKSLQMMTCKILFFSPRTEPKQDPLRPSRTNPRSHWEHLILVKCPLFSPIYIKLQTTNCAVILRYCMSKSDKKCAPRNLIRDLNSGEYVTLYRSGFRACVVHSLHSNLTRISDNTKQPK